MSGIGVGRVSFLFLFEVLRLEDDGIGSCSCGEVLKSENCVCSSGGW